MRTETLDELVDLVRTTPHLSIVGGDTQGAWRLRTEASAPRVSVRLSGIVEHDVADQVVVVRTGTTLAELQFELGKHGQCLPICPVVPLAPGATLGGMVSLNLAHALESRFGAWRDWIVGATVVRPDGTVARCGSKVVKSVAGYDVMKLFVGARGTLGVLTELILRTCPVKALPKPDLIIHRDFGAAGWVQRTLRSDFDKACQAAGEQLLAASPGSSTLYLSGKPQRFPEDKLVGWGQGAQNLQIEDATLRQTMRRAKNALDPEAKLNAGEFGFL
jgi:glycolate oxidase FAD binding subunit